MNEAFETDGLHGSVQPAKPEQEGDCFGYVRCENPRCPAQPVVKDGSLLSDMRGPGAYKDRAISRWNRRARAGKEDA